MKVVVVLLRSKKTLAKVKKKKYFFFVKKKLIEKKNLVEEKIIDDLKACETREECLRVLRTYLKLPITCEPYSEYDFGDYRTSCQACDYKESAPNETFIECPSCGCVEDVEFETIYGGASEENSSFTEEMSISEEDEEDFASSLRQKMMTFMETTYPDPISGASAIEMAQRLVFEQDMDDDILFDTLARFANEESDCDCSPSQSSIFLGRCDGFCGDQTDWDVIECTADETCGNCHGSRTCPECDGWGSKKCWEKAKRDY